jgi:hypothetical protein
LADIQDKVKNVFFREFTQNSGTELYISMFPTDGNIQDEFVSGVQMSCCKIRRQVKVAMTRVGYGSTSIALRGTKGRAGT